MYPIPCFMFLSHVGYRKAKISANSSTDYNSNFYPTSNLRSDDAFCRYSRSNGFLYLATNYKT